MKSTKKYYRKTLMVLCMVTLGVMACGNDDDGLSDQDEQTTASIQLKDQDPFALEASTAVAAAAQSNKISLNFTDTKHGLMLMISLISTEEKIAGGQSYSMIPGDLGGDGMGTAKLNPVGSASVIEEGYTTVKDIDGDGKFDGSGTVNITSLTEKHIAGTFTITMYNNAGEKALVKEGQFNMAIDFTF